MHFSVNNASPDHAILSSDRRSFRGNFEDMTTLVPCQNGSLSFIFIKVKPSLNKLDLNHLFKGIRAKDFLWLFCFFLHKISSELLFFYSVGSTIDVLRNIQKKQFSV